MLSLSNAEFDAGAGRRPLVHLDRRHGLGDQPALDRRAGCGLATAVGDALACGGAACDASAAGGPRLDEQVAAQGEAKTATAAATTRA